MSKIHLSKKNKLNQWLDSKVNDITIKDKYEITNNNLNPYYGKYENELYFDGKDDTDIQANDIFYLNLIRNVNEKSLNELIKYIDRVLIPPNTNRYHANQLYKKMVDYIIDNNFNYDIFNDETKEYDSINLI